MATNNFKLKITTQDSDGNTASENVSVNSGPSECTPPIVTFAFPSGVRAEVGDSIDPFWSASTFLAPVFCKVFPTARPDEGGDGAFLVQAYSTAAKWPNSPDSRFEQTFEGVGGQLTEVLDSTTSNFMVVSSGIGVTGSGLVQSADLVGLRKAIQITDDAIATSTGATTTRFGKKTRVASRQELIGDDDEGISAYTHDLTNNRVYTLERGNRSFGRIPQTWPIGTNITFHPYHYVPMYVNAGAVDLQFIPHIMVQEVGTQYPLTGTMNVTGITVSGTNTDFFNEISGSAGGGNHISGAGNLIKFGDAESWYVISGIQSSSVLVIYDYGDNLNLTAQPAQVNCYTLGSGTVSVQPDLTGCSSWDIRLSPQFSTGDTVASLSVDYTVLIDATVVGGAISGTPNYEWEVLSGTVFSGLNPGNLATQTVIYETGVAQRIRVTVSGSGQPTCTHQYDTGNLSLIEGVSAGTWKSLQTTEIGTGGQVVAKIRSQLQGSRLADKFYHHHLSAMKPLQTKITSLTTATAGSIFVTAGDIDAWPTKGTVIIKGGTVTLFTGFFTFSVHQIYHRFSYTGKTNDRLTGIVHRGNFGVPTTAEFDQTKIGPVSVGINAPSGSDIWIQQNQPHPFSKIEAITGANKVRLRDVAGIHNGSAIKWVRFAPSYEESAAYRARGGRLFDQPYRIISTNSTTREITLDRNLHAAIKENMLCIMQPYTDQTVGFMYPSSVSQDRLNFWSTTGFFVYNPDEISSLRNTTITSSTGVTLYVWDPMQNIIKGRSEAAQQMRIPQVGRMLLPRGTSSLSKGIVIEYNGYTGPIPSFVLAGIPFPINGIQANLPGIFALENVKIVTALSDSGDDVSVGPRTLLIPYQDMEITPLSVLTFEPTDADIGYNFDGGTSKHIGWSQPLADQIFVTDSIDPNTTNQDIVSIPDRTNYESQHFSAWPQAAIRSAPPVHINKPLVEPPTGSFSGGGSSGCIHYNTIVKVWNGEDYDEVQIKDVKVGQKIHTPEGPKEVMNRIESRHGKTHIITIADGRSVHCTEVHPIATLYDGKIVWRKAVLIEQGEKVMTDMGPQTVNANICVSFTGRTIHPFYDLQVVDVHQFYANGILVHNKAIEI